MIGAAFVSVEVHYGYGRHQSCLTAHQILKFQKYIWGEWIQTFASLMWTKVSICLFFLRIPISKRLTRPLQWSVVALILSNVVLTLCWILQCRPIRAAWDTTANGRCFSRGQKQRIIFAQASNLIFLTTDSRPEYILKLVQSSRWSQILLLQAYPYCYYGMCG